MWRLRGVWIIAPHWLGSGDDGDHRWDDRYDLLSWKRVVMGHIADDRHRVVGTPVVLEPARRGGALWLTSAVIVLAIAALITALNAISVPRDRDTFTSAIADCQHAVWEKLGSPAALEFPSAAAGGGWTWDLDRQRTSRFERNRSHEL